MTGRAIDLVYICDWLPPDFGAVGQYALQFARGEAMKGKALSLYGLSTSGPSEEIERHGAGTLKIVRVYAPPYDRTNLRARAWWTLKTNLRLIRSALGDMRASSEVLFTGSPPLMLHLMGPLNVFLRKKLKYRITDFYPECLVAEYPRAPLMLRALAHLTKFWRRGVAEFEVLGEDQRRRLVESGVPTERIVLMRDRSPVAIDANTRPLPRPSRLAGFRILLYSGNFGVAHDYATFLEGYRRHHREGTKRVAVWLNAIGRAADILERSLKEEGLPHLRTSPVPLEKLGSLLVTPDAHLVTLREPFWGYVLPSKVYGCIASGRPILYIGPTESDVFLLGKSASAFIRVANGNSEGVKVALDQLSAAT